ncbi:MAG: TraB/GumN family protein [Bacteroides sp.]|nr:TraB/GumN family protein [Bacteroides sp.]MCM1413690.1 TraB/GumN family protein [Bacteroides sp.]MCM1471869.1 TraB/GumN family protein [Bacteroides sp.]
MLSAIIAISSLTADAQLLWRITPPSPDARPSYIMGSHHAAPTSIADDLNVAQLMPQVDIAFGELSLDDLNPMSIQAALQQSVMASADSTLDKVLTPDQLALVDSAITTLSDGTIPMASKMFNNFKPAMLNNIITMLLAARELPTLDPNNTLDAYVLSMAKTSGLPVKGLETVSDQIKVLYGSPISQQVRELLKIISADGFGAEQMHLMTRAYLNHDLAAVTDLIFSDDEYDATSDTLIKDRNDRWVQFLLGFLPTSTALIIVGAGHLSGENGVLTQLEKAGYNVEPIDKILDK